MRISRDISRHIDVVSCKILEFSAEQSIFAGSFRGVVAADDVLLVILQN